MNQIILNYRIPKQQLHKSQHQRTLVITQQYELKDAVSTNKFKTCKILHIKNANITDKTTEYLWTMKHDPNIINPLQEINLAQNFSFITDNAISNICQCSILFPLLKTINLADNTITDKGIQLLAKSQYENLEKLILYGNSDLTSESLFMFSKSLVFSILKILDLHATSIDDEGLMYFVKSPNSHNLNILNVSMNWKRITDKSLYAISTSQYCKNIKQLILQDCGITDIGIAALCESENIENIQVLNINNSIKTTKNQNNNNLISDESLQALTYARSIKNLRVLEMRNSAITTKGLSIFSQSLKSENLQILKISHCIDINDEATFHLQKIIKYMSLKKLYINSTSITKSKCQQLQSKYPQIHLIY